MANTEIEYETTSFATNPGHDDANAIPTIIESEPVLEIVEEEEDSTNLATLSMLRGVRDRLLRETDHWALEDTPTMSQQQIEYRQALRDITETYTSTSDVVWPSKPV